MVWEAKRYKKVTANLRLKLSLLKLITILLSCFIWDFEESYVQCLNLECFWPKFKNILLCTWKSIIQQCKQIIEKSKNPKSEQGLKVVGYNFSSN